MPVTRIHPQRPAPPPRRERCTRQHVMVDPAVDGHLHVISGDYVHCSLDGTGLEGHCTGDDDPNAEIVNL